MVMITMLVLDIRGRLIEKKSGIVLEIPITETVRILGLSFLLCQI